MSKTVCYMIIDKKGNPAVGSKICASLPGAKNGMNPFIWGEIMKRIKNDEDLKRVYYTEGGGYGKPKHLDPYDVVRKAHRFGNTTVDEKHVEKYNEIVDSCADYFSIKEIELK